MQGYGTVRDVEETEKEGEKPVQECRIADCGEIPSNADLTSIPTFIAQVRAATCKQQPRGTVRVSGMPQTECSAAHHERRFSKEENDVVAADRLELWCAFIPCFYIEGSGRTMKSAFFQRSTGKEWGK